MAEKLKKHAIEGGNVRGEVTACPTGLSTNVPVQPPPEPTGNGPDAQEVHGPLEVEKLEGRQGADEEE
jgi:hypothetical protein